jgi:hypothetical protein
MWILLACATEDPELRACLDACDRLWGSCDAEYDLAQVGLDQQGAPWEVADHAAWTSGCDAECEAAADAGLYTERSTFSECVNAHADDIDRDPPDRTACLEAAACDEPCTVPRAAFVAGEGSSEWECW